MTDKDELELRLAQRELRRSRGLSDWEIGIEDRMDSQGEKIDELLALFKGSKIALAILGGLATIMASISVIWHNFGNGR